MTIKYIFTILTIAGLISSCTKSPKCWGDDKIKGIINSTIQIDCRPKISQENFVINSDSVYQQTFLDSSRGQTNCDLPSIDFDTYTLLGLRAEGNCEVKIIREVKSIENENKYHYKVNVKSCGLCKRLMIADNWVIVPKLPSSWTVTFEVN